MKFGVIIPDRNDRPQFTRLCFEMIQRQSVQPYEILHVNYVPKSTAFDLTERVRTGFEQLQNKVDVVFIIENDDWYSPDYFEQMLEEWQKNGRPDLFGISSTVYYHIKKLAFNILEHSKHSSLMSTMIRTSANIDFPKDDFVFLDLHLWQNHKGILLNQNTRFPLAVGIKHGVGLVGGSGHHSMRFKERDNSEMYELWRMIGKDVLQYRKILAEI